MQEIISGAIIGLALVAALVAEMLLRAVNKRVSPPTEENET